MADEKSPQTKPRGILHVGPLDLWRRVYQNADREHNPDAEPAERVLHPVPGRTDPKVTPRPGLARRPGAAVHVCWKRYRLIQGDNHSLEISAQQLSAWNLACNENASQL